MKNFDYYSRILVLAELLVANACPMLVAGNKCNVEGHIKCGGKGVQGVYVTDGYKWTQTDRRGRYELQSGKENNCVFYVLPSGYEPAAGKRHSFMPDFWRQLNGDVNKKEKHDFEIKKTGITDYKLIVATDQHLALRRNDISQYKNFYIKNIKNLVKDSHERFYTVSLGDAVWDEFMYEKKFFHEDYINLLAECNYPTPIFHIMGNHDNDPAIPASDKCDFLASDRFRKSFGPRYFSMNLGNVHIICLDDIVYNNYPPKEGEAIPVGASGNPDYYFDEITGEQLDWMKEDLSHVTDAGTPILVCIHSQAWALNTDDFSVKERLHGGNNAKLASVLSGFKNVKIVSGHTHYNFHAHPAQYPNIHENNIAAVCGTWWHTNTLSPRHLCRDGSPAGYELYDIKGNDITWKYKAIDPIDSVGDHQMRVYDVNALKRFYANNDGDIKAFYGYYPKLTDYSKFDDNEIVVNVFDYDTDWKVEITEDGKPLDVARYSGIDPLHMLSCGLQLAKSGKKPGGSRPVVTTHLFRAKAAAATSSVTVKVTDSFGRTYTENLVRPKSFDVNMR